MSTTKKLKFSHNKVINILLIILFALSIMIALSSIIASIIPFFYGDCIESCKSFISYVNNIYTSIIPIAGVVISLLNKMGKRDSDNESTNSDHENSKISDNVPIGIFLILLIFIVVFNVTGAHIISTIEKKNEVGKGVEESTILVEETTQALTVQFDLNDVLCEYCGHEYIQENFTDFKFEILSLLENAEFSKVEGNYEQYSRMLKNINDYEDTFGHIFKNGYFIEEDKDIRINILDKGLKKRINANEIYKTALNQRLISVRYLDIAVEYVRSNEKEKAIVAYKEAIKWAIYAIQTKINIGSQEKYVEMFKQIHNAYSGISAITKDDSIEFNCAKILGAIFDSIASEFVD